MCSFSLIVLVFIEYYLIYIHSCYEYISTTFSIIAFHEIRYHNYKQHIHMNIWIMILWCFAYHIPWSTSQQFLRYSVKRKTFVLSRPSLFLRFINNHISPPKHLQNFVKSILIILQFSDLVLLSPTCSPWNYSHYSFLV